MNHDSLFVRQPATMDYGITEVLEAVVGFPNISVCWVGGQEVDTELARRAGVTIADVKKDARQAKFTIIQAVIGTSTVPEMVMPN